VHLVLLEAETCDNMVLDSEPIPGLEKTNQPVWEAKEVRRCQASE
jgi:hypothetical protein